MSNPYFIENESTTSVQQDLNRLGRLLSSLQPAPNESVVERQFVTREIVSILKTHPEFCDDNFDTPYIPGVAWCRPLKILLFAGVDLQTLEEVCKLHSSESLMYQGDVGRSPLHFACAHCVSTKKPGGPVAEEAVQLLANQCREALKIKDRYNEYPLSIALRKNLSRSVIEHLMDLYPRILNGCHDDKHGSVPLGTAIAHACSSDVIELLINRLQFTLPRSYNAQSLDLKLYRLDITRSLDLENSVVIGEIQSQYVMSILMVQFKSLNFKCLGWTRSGLAHFLQYLKTKSSLRVVDQLSLSFDGISHDPGLLLLLQEFCQENTGLKRLCISKCPCYVGDGISDTITGDSIDDEEYTHNIPMLQAIATGINNNPNFQEIEVNDLRLPDIQSLIAFLLSNIAPPQLKLFNLKLGNKSSDRYDPNYNDGNMIESRLEGLHLRNPGLAPESFNHLLLQLSRLPYLKTLCLTSDVRLFRHGCGPLLEFPIISESLATLLEEGSSLQSLTLIGFICDHEMICKALQKNTLLQHLEIRDNSSYYSEHQKMYLELLKYHNATLRTLDFANGHDPPISYYLILNKYRRAEARDPKISLSCFINILDAVPSFHHETLLYGLLRETPSIWCGMAAEPS